MLFHFAERFAGDGVLY